MKTLIAFLPLFILFINPVTCQSFKIDWQNCYGGSNWDHAEDMIQTNGGYLVLGFIRSNDGDVSYNHGDEDVWLIKIDSIGTLLWEKSYGGSKSDGGIRLFKANGNSSYIVGVALSSDGDISYDPYPNSIDYWILKIDSIGGIIWEKIKGGPGEEQIWNATTATDGGIVGFGITKAAGGDISNYFGSVDMWMIKLNSDGETAWDFTIGTSWIDFGQAIIQTSDGGYLAGGGSRIEEGGNLTCEPYNYMAEAILMKLDSNRNIEWQQCYGGSGDEGVTGLLEVADGYIFLAYATEGDGDLTGSGWHGAADIWVVRTDFTGNIIWQKCFGGSSYEFASRIFQTEDGGFVVVGEVKSLDGDVVGNHSINDRYDIWMFKITGEGELVWQRCIGGISDEMLDFGVVKKSDYKYVLAGSANLVSFDVTCTQNTSYHDYWVLQVSDTTVNITENDAEINALKVYPNPASDYVVFERQSMQTNQQKQDIIQIMNVFGQVVETFEMHGNKTVWDTKEIKPGVYFYKYGGSGCFGKVVKW